jgi:hypothetical protein
MAPARNLDIAFDETSPDSCEQFAWNQSLVDASEAGRPGAAVERTLRAATGLGPRLVRKRSLRHPRSPDA